MEKLLSVIIYVCDAEHTLERCVGSVIYQSYRNIEIILIDNGSTDKSANVCDSLTQLYACIKVEHLKKTSIGNALNSGIEMASGEYVAFLGSGDNVQSDLYSCLINTIENYGVTVAEAGFEKTQFFKKYYTNVNKKMEISCSKDALAKNYSMKGFSTKYWNKVYQANLLKDIRFPSCKGDESEFFTWKVYANAQSLATVEAKMYFRNNRQRDDMTTLSYAVDFVSAYKERLQHDEAFDEELFQFGQKSYVKLLYERLKWLVNDKKPWRTKKHPFYIFAEALSKVDDDVFITLYPSSRRLKAIKLLRKSKFLFRVMFTCYTKYYEKIVRK